MLTDEEIAALTPTERRELIARLVRPVEELAPSRRWLRRTREVRVAAMVLSAVVLVPWIGYLALTLPRVYGARHWDVAWVGFDVALLVLTAVAVELPLAGLLVAGAFQVLRLVAARAWLLQPGAHAWQIPIPLPSAGDQAVRPVRPAPRQGR